MRRLFLMGLLLALAGCQNVAGPFTPKRPVRVDDPLLTIDEQERRGRARLSLPDESPEAGPHTGAAPPGVFGRWPPGR